MLVIVVTCLLITEQLPIFIFFLIIVVFLANVTLTLA